VASFDDRAVRDASVRTPMSKIKVIPDDAIETLLPQKTFMRVVATTMDGRRHVVEVFNPLGHPDNPMQDRHIEEKFISLVESNRRSVKLVAELPSRAGGGWTKQTK
jgi:2-methylcitrate dehydratase PrpD